MPNCLRLFYFITVIKPRKKWLQRAFFIRDKFQILLELSLFDLADSYL